MSRTTLPPRLDARRAARLAVRGAVALALLAGLVPELAAQAALGAPFIGRHAIRFETAELTRDGSPEMTTVVGGSYGRQLGRPTGPSRFAIHFRGSARPFDDAEAGVLDVSSDITIDRAVRQLPGISVAGSLGLSMMGWGDDIAETGRLLVSVPMTAGVAYDLRIGGATLAPYFSYTIAAYDMRTGVDNVQTSRNTGWDARHAIGTSLRLKEVVLTSSRIVGEYGMPTGSRWTFSAGISY